MLCSVPILINIATKVSAPAGGGPDFFVNITSNGLFAALASLVLELPLFLPVAVAAISADAIASLLIAALTDPDEVVRVLAENSVWQVWTRSGDKEVDGLMQAGIEQNLGILATVQGDHERALAHYGLPEPRVLASDGATAVYLAEAARASMESGRAVDMKTFVQTGAVA